ncbi:GNAT family N-acetyltransferase [Streptomyces sp. NPDC059698]|uniref:GNAT family N-acetyltransferase n=1 Tax=unclassified Streptomyces TaxID=2593676 RepID=UPI000938C866|nr:GNAT family N-acetyltransferase [Streptomyces sp. CB02366]OKJ31913.1 aminoglycoside 2'-N-acetyltransferase [Streptomyces sp. CB02366]WSS57905.1 GNAT family N-acetyltransferase [Streptomyces sp. NBC_01178]
MASTPAVRIAHTCELVPAELARIRELLDAAFEGGFDDHDWDHALGGLHALVLDPYGRPIAHGSVVQRRVQHADRSYRVGYVEAVAVRADHRREGLGHRVMAALEHVIDRAYDLGALSASDAGAALYAARGWQVWPGRLAALGPAGPVPLPEEEGSTHVRPAAGRSLPDPGHPLRFDWRDGDLL